MVKHFALPQVLTMDEYRSQWEPDGWQLIIIGPISTWRQDCGDLEWIQIIPTGEPNQIKIISENSTGAFEEVLLGQVSY